MSVAPANAPPGAAARHLLTREELLAWGEAFGRAARPPMTVCISGDLGAGKTTLVQAICSGYGVLQAVTSPTFALVHEYASPRGSVFHLDLYRLRDARDLTNLGWHEIVGGQSLVLIEWPERAAGALPRDVRPLWLGHMAGDDTRRALIAP